MRNLSARYQKENTPDIDTDSIVHARAFTVFNIKCSIVVHLHQLLLNLERARVCVCSVSLSRRHVPHNLAHRCRVFGVYADDHTLYMRKLIMDNSNFGGRSSRAASDTCLSNIDKNLHAKAN